jgi:hypothetical protein
VNSTEEDIANKTARELTMCGDFLALPTDPIYGR